MKRNTYFMDEEVAAEKVDVKYLKRILARIVPYKKMFLLALLLLALSSVAALLPPVLIRGIVNDVIPAQEGRTRMLALYLTGLAVLGALTALLPYFHKRIMGTLGHKIISEVRREIFIKLQQLPFEYYDTRPAGKISIRVTEYVNELADFFTEYLLNLIVDVLKVVVATVFMLALSPLLTAVVYAAVVPLTVCVFFIKRAVRRLFRKHRAKNSNRNAFIVESIMGEKVIKANNRSQYNRAIYRDLQEDSASTWMQIVRRNELNAPVSELFWNGGILALYAVAFALILGGSASMAGTVIAFTLYTSICAEPLLQFTAILQQLSQVSANLERIYETVDAPVTIHDAEHAVALMLALNRKIHRAYWRTRDGNFSLHGLMGFDMYGKTVGIIGTGKIARELIRILKGFGMEVLAYDLYPDEAYAAQAGITYVSLEELYGRSDIISLHCPLTDRTRYMIGDVAISHMKPGVVIINTGRGQLIHTEALIDGLKEKRIGAAGLDVYEEEAGYFYEDTSDRIMDDDVLARVLSFNNVIVTSHQAFFTREALENIARTTLDNLRAFDEGTALVNEVSLNAGR